jgi:hypothetical protein
MSDADAGEVAAVRSVIGSGQPLEPEQRGYFEQRLGVPLEHARIQGLTRLTDIHHQELQPEGCPIATIDAIIAVRR